MGDGAEVDAGGDPTQNQDIDGDGWLDAEESAAGSDPSNAFSWPFGTDRWPDLSENAEGIDGTTYATGEIFPNFTTYDQFGNEVSLYQFYGYAILLDFSAMWCGPCQDAASGTQIQWEEYCEQGYMVITMLTEDFEGNPPEAAECMEWANAFGLEYPVLGGEVPDEAYFDLYDAGLNEGYIPYLLLLDQELRIYKSYSGSGNEAAIERDLKALGFQN